MKSQHKPKRGQRAGQQTYTRISAAIEEHLLELGVDDPLASGGMDRDHSLCSCALQCGLQSTRPLVNDESESDC
jgi:hypothetical protein